MSQPINIDVLAETTLGLDDPAKVSPACLVHTGMFLKTQLTSQRAPPHYIKALAEFLHTNPMDQHFIMELGEVGSDVGGNGYGSVTCMSMLPTCLVLTPADPIRHGRLLLGSESTETRKKRID